jgi:hypothetical protein
VPRGFRKTALKGSWKSILGIIGLTAIATVVFICIATWFDLEAELSGKLLIAAGAVVILCLVQLGFTRLMLVVVKITDKAIVWELGDTPTTYRFGAINHCEIRNASVGGGTIPVLVVALKNGDRRNDWRAWAGNEANVANGQISR